jgi:hypothetical protein
VHPLPEIGGIAQSDEILAECQFLALMLTRGGLSSGRCLRRPGLGDAGDRRSLRDRGVVLPSDRLS